MSGKINADNVDMAVLSLKPFPEITKNVEQFKKELEANKVSKEFLKLCKDATAELKNNNTIEVKVVKYDR